MKKFKKDPKTKFAFLTLSICFSAEAVIRSAAAYETTEDQKLLSQVAGFCLQNYSSETSSETPSETPSEKSNQTISETISRPVPSGQSDADFDAYVKNWKDTGKPLPGKPPKDNGYLQCICDRMKQLHKQGKSTNGQLAEYCAAWEEYDMSVGMESVLLVLDTAVFAACTTACAMPAAVVANEICNCLGIVDQAIDFSLQMTLFAKSLEYQSPTSSQIIMGPILGGGMMGLSSYMAVTQCKLPGGKTPLQMLKGVPK